MPLSRPNRLLRRTSLTQPCAPRNDVRKMTVIAMTVIVLTALCSLSTLSQAQLHVVTVNINQPAPLVVNAGNDITLCHGSGDTLHAAGGTSYTWSPSYALSCTDCANPFATPDTTTTYIIQGTNQYGCTAMDTITVTVYPHPAADAGNNVSLCYGDSVQLSASGGVSYSWYPSTGLNDPSVATPLAKPTATTTYTVIVTNNEGCTDRDSVVVNVAAAPTTMFSVSSASVVVGHHVLIPILLSDSLNGNVKEFALDVSYDSTMLLPYSIETKGTMCDGAVPSMNILSPGLMRVTVSRSTPFTGSGELFKIDFRGMISSRATVSPIHIENISFIDAPCNTITKTDGEVTMTGCESDRFIGSGVVLLQNTPNPFSQSTVVSYQLSVEGEAELSLYDMFGRKVKTVVREYQSKGDHSVVITTEDLPNGLYAYQLRAGNKLFTKKMAVIK